MPFSPVDFLCLRSLSALIRRPVFLTLALLVPMGGPGLRAAESTGDGLREIFLQEDFDAGDFPEGWEKGGDIRVVADEKFTGRGAVRLERTRDRFDLPTFLLSGEFPLPEEAVEISGAFKADLDSPDSSFHAAVELEALDEGGRVVDTRKLDDIFGKRNWTRMKKTVTLSEKAVKGRLRIKLNKAIGTLWADNLIVKAGEAAPQNPVKRVAIKTKVTGNLFFPGKPEPFEISVQTVRPLPADHQTITALVTDYWGAEQSKPVAYPLEAKGSAEGIFEYATKIDLSGFVPEIGRYYELRTVVDGGAGDPVREVSAFAFLPEAVTKAYSWREIPFSSRNWDNRMTPYFALSDRIGIRLAGVWGMWEPKPPFAPSAPGFDDIKRLGLTMLTRTPIVQIEHHRGGYEAFTDEALRGGVAPFFEKFGQDGEIVITLGNEPQPSGPTVARNVGIYKLMYEQVKKVSPGTFVVGTSIGPAEEYFKLGFQKFSDAVDFHTYEDSKGLKEIFDKYKALFAKYGGEQPIWATEMGLNAQGLSRRVVAAELIKKFAWFFSFGGANGSWFGICYPDRVGKLRGSAEDAFNVFDGLYGNFSPRLDALAYYNVVNGICIKKFADYRAYEDDLHSFLFVDRNGDNLQILWKDHGAKDVSVPMQPEGGVKVTRLDGTSALLEAGKNGPGLRVGEDPVILAYKGSQKTLPERLGAPAVAVLEVPSKIVRGGTVDVVLGLEGIAPADLKADLPPGWKAGPLEAKDGRMRMAVTAPSDTDARYVPIRFLQKAGDLELVIPVQGQISAEMQPAVMEDGRPAVDLVLRNNNSRAEAVTWRLAFLQQVSPVAGLYTVTTAEPAEAYFADASEGKLTLEANAVTHLKVPLAGVDPITSYKIRGVITDGSGRASTMDRFFGGFVGVPKARQPMELDGALSEPGWQRAVPRRLERESQVRHLAKTSQWTGPEDLSGVLRFLWDDKYLYVGLEVTDDVFRNEEDDSAIWRGDGVQFLIDPARSRADKPGKYDYALGFGKNGPAAWGYLSADGAAPTGEAGDIVVSASPGKEGTGGKTYEIAIPWSRLAPFQPGKGANLGMAVILNEDDAPKRDGFMTWFGDIQSKEVDCVGDLILGD